LALAIVASKSLAVTIEPGRCAFDDPAAREDFKTDRADHATHDFDRPIAEFGELQLPNLGILLGSLSPA
jgi:hypothetical protein